MKNFKLWRQRVYTAAKLAKGGIPNSRFDTSDIAQESLLQLLKSGVEKSNLNQSYLNKVGKGNTARMLRDNSAKKRDPGLEVKGLELDALKSSDSDPLELLQDRERVVDLIKAISQLAPEYQFVIYRKFFDSTTYEEIAKEMECTPNAVRGKIERAKTQLRQLLSDEFRS